jgi:hypothetical protein
MLFIFMPTIAVTTAPETPPPTAARPEFSAAEKRDTGNAVRMKANKSTAAPLSMGD